MTRILTLLVERRLEAPGAAATVQELHRAGWPEEARLSSDVLANRLRVAVYELRRLGLGDRLRTEPNGYALCTEITVQRRHHGPPKREVS